MSQRGRVALVTGASRGIGFATARALAARRVSLQLLGRRSAELHTAADRCVAEGAPHAEAIELDLADLSAVAQAGDSLARQAPPDIVIHNAGVVRRAPVEELSIEAWQEQMAVNLTAPFLLTRALLPAMRRAGHGRIVFVASISSTIGSKNQSAYAASKWAILGFMKSLAEELTDTGLMTAAVLPGSVQTKMLEGSGFSPRMSADDVARTLTFLALDAPLAHNGAVIEMFGT